MIKTNLARRLRIAGAAFIITLAASLSAQAGDAKDVQLQAKPDAAKASLEGISGKAKVEAAKGDVEITVTLPDGKSLPKGAVLEGWLSTAAGEKNSKPEAERAYTLSTGILGQQGEGQTFVGHFHIDNDLTPYVAVAVTLEADGNKGNYDPRPGSPLLEGMIK